MGTTSHPFSRLALQLISNCNVWHASRDTIFRSATCIVAIRVLHSGKARRTESAHTMNEHGKGRCSPVITHRHHRCLDDVRPFPGSISFPWERHDVDGVVSRATVDHDKAVAVLPSLNRKKQTATVSTFTAAQRDPPHVCAPRGRLGIFLRESVCRPPAPFQF